MKTITLTEEEAHHLSAFLRNILSPDSWLGSNYIGGESYGGGPKAESAALRRIVQRLKEVEAVKP